MIPVWLRFNDRLLTAPKKIVCHRKRTHYICKPYFRLFIIYITASVHLSCFVSLFLVVSEIIGYLNFQLSDLIAFQAPRNELSEEWADNLPPVWFTFVSYYANETNFSVRIQTLSKHQFVRQVLCISGGKIYRFDSKLLWGDRKCTSEK